MSALDLTLRLIAWAVAGAFALTFAYQFLRILRTQDTALDLLGFSVLAILGISLMVLISGLAGVLNATFLGIVSALGLAIQISVAPLRVGLFEFQRWLGSILDRLGNGWRDLPLWIRWFAALWVAIGVLRFAFLIWALPPFVWDSMTYHLTNMAHWVQSGRIELFETSVQRIYTPANYELLATWFTVYLHHDAFVEAAGIPAYVVAGLATYSIARSLGARRSGALLGAMAYLSTPAFLIAVTGTKNDPHMAAYYLAATALLLDFIARRRSMSERGVLSRIVLFALVVLIAAGTKAYLIHLVPGIFVMALAWSLYGGGSVRWRSVPGQVAAELRRLSQQGRLAILGLTLGAVFLGGYWNVRNWLLTGNPFYPYGVSIQSRELIQAADRSAKLTTERLQNNLQLLGERFGDTVGAIEPDLPNTTGWGWTFYGLGLPLVGWALLRRGKFRIVFGGFLVSFLLLMLSIRPSPFNMRYLAWFPAVGAIAVALWFDALSDRLTVLRRAFAGLIILTVGLNLAMTFNYNRISPDKFALMLERPLWEREAAVLKLNMPEEYEFALVQIPDGKILGYDVHGDGFIYPLYRADLSQRLVYFPIRADATCGEIAADANAAGASYLFVARGHSSPESIARLQECSQASERIEGRGRGVYAVDGGA